MATLTAPIHIREKLAELVDFSGIGQPCEMFRGVESSLTDDVGGNKGRACLISMPDSLVFSKNKLSPEVSGGGKKCPAAAYSPLLIENTGPSQACMCIGGW